MLELLYLVPIFIAIWIAHTVVWATLAILAWVLVPIATFSGAYYKAPAPHNPHKTEALHFSWRFMRIYSNDEDGIKDGHWAVDLESKLSPYFGASFAEKMQILYYSLWRNPVNNIRFAPLFTLKLDPAKVRYVGSQNAFQDSDNHTAKVWYLAWQGYKAGFRFHIIMKNSAWRFWFGWKVRPNDSSPDTWQPDHRKIGVGFAYQFRRTRQF